MIGNPSQRTSFRKSNDRGRGRAVRCVLTALCLSTAATTTLVEASERVGDWPSFRNGGASKVAGRLPQQWSPQNGILWQRETDGYGQSAPVVMAGRVYVTSVIGDTKEICAINAFELQTGEQAWQTKNPASQQGPSNYMNSRAAPTPAADTTGVYAFFETGNLIAVDYDGELLWQRDLARHFGPFESNHGLGSSVAQTEDLLILNLEHKGPSLLIAIDKQDGTTRWKADRPSGSSWTTPVVIADPDHVVVSSAGSLTSYDAASGREIWSQKSLEGNSVPSPCVAGRNIIVGARIPEFGSAAEAAKSNLCVTLDGDSPRIRWRATNAVCDYASPVVDDGQVYFLNKVGVLSCVDAHTGAAIYRERLRAECWATPVVAENGIYFFAKDGSVKVVRRGKNFDVIATNHLWDSADPPKPESYREASGSHGHGSHDGGSRPGGGRSGRMLSRLMKGDANADGILQPGEIPPGFRAVLKRVDTDGDGSLDSQEISAMAKSFAERRKNSRTSARDPIVYGVAAVPGFIVVRSGTRLYCVAEVNASLPDEETSP